MINTNDVITFYGASVTELREEMQKSIEGYLEFRKEQGKIPEKPFSGEFTVQMSPEMHCKLALNAERLHLDFNVYLQGVLEKAASVDLSTLNLVDYRKECTDSMIDNKLMESQATVAGRWTVERIRNSLSKEVRDYHEKYPEHRCNLFYRRITEIQNLVANEGWRLNPPKISKSLCGFWLKDAGITRFKRVFGICLEINLPNAELVDRKGERVTDFSRSSNPPRVFVAITMEEAEQLEGRYSCDFFAIDRSWVYYDIPEDVSELLPVLEFAYNKHRRN